MKRILSMILFFALTVQAWSYVNQGYVSVVATSSSSGVSSTSVNSDIYDNIIAHNVGIGSTSPNGTLDVGALGTICLGGVCESAWPAGGSQTSGSNMLFGNGAGGYTNVSGSGTTGGNVGIGSTNPGSKLDVMGNMRVLSGNVGIGTSSAANAMVVVGTIQATGYTGQAGNGILGTWSTCTLNSNIHATAGDLWVSGYGTPASSTASSIQCMTDATATPSVLITTGQSSSTALAVSCDTFVKKGQYYNIATNNLVSTGCNYIQLSN